MQAPRMRAFAGGSTAESPADASQQHRVCQNTRMHTAWQQARASALSPTRNALADDASAASVIMRTAATLAACMAATLDAHLGQA